MTDHPFDRDETQPHDTDAYRASFGSGSVQPAQPARPPQAAASYSPLPESRTDWAGGKWSQPDRTPERWFETTAPTDRPPTAPVEPRRTGTGVGSVLAAALAAAVLASGGTVVALRATGALDRVAAPAGGGPNAASVIQPVTVDESSAIIDVATKAGPSVVRIFEQGVDPNSVLPQQTQGIGSGIIFDPNGWSLKNPPPVSGGRG